jgi:hypothetical protein
MIQLPHSPLIRIISSQNERRKKVHHFFHIIVIIVEGRVIKEVIVGKGQRSVEIIEKVIIVCRNQHSSGQNSGGCHIGNIYGEQRFHGSHQGGNKCQRRLRNQEGSAQGTVKVSGEGGVSLIVRKGGEM